MKQKPAGRASSSEQIIRDITRKTRKQYSAEEKIRIVLDGLRGEDSIVIFPRDTGHRVKNHIMTMIQNEVLDEKGTQKVQSGIQERSSSIGDGTWLELCDREFYVPNREPGITLCRA